MANKDINVKINIQDNTSKTLGNIESSFSGLKNAASGAAIAIGAIGAVLGVGLKMAADFEQTSIAFRTMLGDAQAAGSLLSDLSKFAAETPFEFPEIANAGKKLLAFGIASGDVKTRLREIGDVASALAIPLGELSDIYGKIQVQGRLYMEDINQLQGRGIPIVAQLAKQYNVNEAAIRGMVEKGKIGAKDIETAFTQMTAAGGQFAGGMAAQSKSLSGLFSTVSDSLGALARNIVGISDTGEVRLGSMFDKVRTWLADMIVWFDENKNAVIDTVNSLTEGIGQYFSAFYDLFSEIFGLVWDIFSSVFEAMGVNSAGTTKSIAENWQNLFKFFSIVINGLALGFSQMVSGVKFAFKSLVNAAGIAIDSVIGGVLIMVAGAMSPLQDIINTAIKGYNLAAEAMGKTGIDLVNFADSLGAKAAAGIKGSWSANTKEIGDDWDSMQAEMTANTMKYGAKIDASIASMGKSTVASISPVTKKVKDLKDSFDNAGAAAKGSSKKAKEAADEAKKAEKERYDALKKSMDESFQALEGKIGTSKASITRMKEEYTKLGDKLKEVSAKGVEELKKIDEQLAKSSEKISGIKSEGTSDVAGRVVKAQEELAQAKDDLAKTGDYIERRDLSNKIDKLKAEIALGTQYAGNAAIQAAITESQKSEVQLIIDKTNEKIKEAQTERDEIQKTYDAKKASIEKEKADITLQMEEKKAKILEEATLYKSLIVERRKFDNAYFELFNTSIDKQITKTKDAIRYMQELSRLGGVSDGTTVAGARANGGPVSSGSTYLVGERGPELFTPGRSGSIIPNESLASSGGGSININMGGITISNAADADALIDRVKTSLIREIKLARKGLYV